MKIRDLEKEEYFMYTNTMTNIQTDYSRTFYIFGALMVLSIIAILGGANLFWGALSIFLCASMLLLSYASVLAKFKHIQRLYKLEPGFSLLK